MDLDCYPYFRALSSFSSLNYPLYLKVLKDLHHYLLIYFYALPKFGKILERKLTFLKLEAMKAIN
jgi:hypothetical protein